MFALDPNLPGPQFVQLFDPILKAVEDLGGSARPAEVRDHIANELELSDEQLAEEIPSGRTTRYANRIGWARFYLAKGGLLDSSQFGVWTLTEKGQKADLSRHEDALKYFREIQERIGEKSGESEKSGPHDGNGEGDDPEAHREEVLKLLQELPPDGFERFCQRLLREAGFQEVEVTGRSGDGGIDGIGVLQVNTLVSFKVIFQCKRYSGSVSSGKIRDFRGAMMGRADKGIILTTGMFTADAKKEAVRDGVIPIELVDGEKLLDMLEDLHLGLKPVRAFQVEPQFFESFSVRPK